MPYDSTFGGGGLRGGLSRLGGRRSRGVAAVLSSAFRTGETWGRGECKGLGRPIPLPSSREVSGESERGMPWRVELAGDCIAVWVVVSLGELSRKAGEAGSRAVTARGRCSGAVWTDGWRRPERQGRDSLDRCYLDVTMRAEGSRCARRLLRARVGA